MKPCAAGTCMSSGESAVGTTTPLALGIAEGNGVSLTLPAWTIAGMSAVAATRAKVQRLYIVMMVILFEASSVQSLSRSYDGYAAAFSRRWHALGCGKRPPETQGQSCLVGLSAKCLKKL